MTRSDDVVTFHMQLVSNQLVLDAHTAGGLNQEDDHKAAKIYYFTLLFARSSFAFGL